MSGLRTAGRGLSALAAAALAVAVISCRTAAPVGPPLAPLTATSAEQAMRELQTRSDELQGARALMRVRVTTPQRAQSFQAELQLDRNAMLLVAFTPLNTAALRLYADENGVVFVNDLQRTAWRGSASEFAASFGAFGDVAPRDMAKLLIGLPASSRLTYDATNAGLARATGGDVAIVYDPPSYPPSRVTVTRGAQKLEVETTALVASSDRIAPLTIPSDYRCCVPPHV